MTHLKAPISSVFFLQPFPKLNLTVVATVTQYTSYIHKKSHYNNKLKNPVTMLKPLVSAILPPSLL